MAELMRYKHGQVVTLQTKSRVLETVVTLKQITTILAHSAIETAEKA